MVRVGEDVRVAVGVRLGVLVRVGLEVRVAVGVRDGSVVRVGLGVAVDVAVRLAVADGVNVRVLVAVEVAVGLASGRLVGLARVLVGSREADGVVEGEAEAVVKPVVKGVSVDVPEGVHVAWMVETLVGSSDERRVEVSLGVLDGSSEAVAVADEVGLGSGDLSWATAVGAGVVPFRSLDTAVRVVASAVSV